MREPTEVANATMLRRVTAVLYATLWTAAPCLLAGVVVGVFFRDVFWQCVAIVGGAALFFAIGQNTQARLYVANLKRLKILAALKYGWFHHDFCPDYWWAPDYFTMRYRHLMFRRK